MKTKMQEWNVISGGGKKWGGHCQKSIMMISWKLWLKIRCKWKTVEDRFGGSNDRNRL